MKKLNFAVLIAALMTVGSKSLAHDIEVANADGVTIYYKYTNNKTELEVTYQGNSSSSKVYVGNVIIPESVTYEGNTYSVTSIGDNAFEYCRSLTSVTIPGSVTSIGSFAFDDCDGLKELTIPNSVTSIGEWAIYSCGGLKELTIGNSVAFIADKNFESCNSLEKITVESGNPNFDSRENCNAIIKTSSNELITGCKNTQFPNSVTSIGKGAFSGCDGLKELTIPTNVTTIGQSAFYGCRGLKELTIPNNVTSIGRSAFGGCALEKITVESGNPIFDSRENCNAIIKTNSNGLIVGCKNTLIPNSVTSIDSSAFNGCSGLTELTIPNSVTSIGYGAFAGCSGLTELIIPNSVTSIGNEAFANCSSLTELIIPNSVTSIGNYAFYYCDGLTEITIPNSVTSIGNYTFYYCSKLTELTIPNSVTSIGERAFFGCSGLTEMTIPNGVTSIGSQAFYWCSGLTTLYSLNTTPPSVDNTNAFDTNHYTNVDLFVPGEALEAYQTAEVWKDFQKLQAINGSAAVTEVSANAEQIHSANGQITVTGLTDGTTVAVYDLSGRQVGTATSKGGQVSISTGMTAGAAAVVKVGDKSVKTVMK